MAPEQATGLCILDDMLYDSFYNQENEMNQVK